MVVGLALVLALLLAPVLVLDLALAALRVVLLEPPPSPPRSSGWGCWNLLGSYEGGRGGGEGRWEGSGSSAASLLLVLFEAILCTWLGAGDANRISALIL